MRFLPFLLCLLLDRSAGLYAQTALVYGLVITTTDGSPATGVFVELPRARMLSRSDAEGRFTFTGVPYGLYTLIAGADSLRIVVDSPVVTLPPFAIGQSGQETLNGDTPESGPGETPVLHTDDDGGQRVNVSGVLSGARDPLSNAMAYSFSAFRFQPRGYERNTQQVLINGALQQDPETGSARWSSWSGLNDAFRAREATTGMGASDYGTGAIYGLQHFTATAAAAREGTRITYSNTNRSYRNRLAVSRNSGLLPGGWYWSAAFSRRSAGTGPVPGTFFSGWSGYAAVSKKLTAFHSLHLTAFGAWVHRGKSSPVTAEVSGIAGTTRYNPSWGIQQGRVRNARTASSFEPQVLLQHQYLRSGRTRWTNTLNVQWGKSANTALDWYNGRDPRPDYYRYLPSWFLQPNSGGKPEDAEFLFRRQIDWDRLYAVNAVNVETQPDYTGTLVTGKRSVYVLSADVAVLRKSGVSSRVAHVCDEHWSVQGGADLLFQDVRRFRELQDLLGGDFFLNLNQFAEQHTAGAGTNQFDLEHPNRLIREGDIYNYHFITHTRYAAAWAQLQGKFRKIEFFLSMSAGSTTLSREGLFRNGIFPANSLGKSDALKFTGTAWKGGLTWKLNGRNYLLANGWRSTDPPAADHAFISLRTRNATVQGTGLSVSRALELGYLLRAPRCNGRLMLFAAEFSNGTEVRRFYNDDPAFRTFVNYVLQGTATAHRGLELATEYKVTPALSVTGVAILYEAWYTANPAVSVFIDNDTMAAYARRDVHIRNYHLANGPQRAYSLSGYYRGRQYWSAGLALNYADHNYMDINPDRRSAEGAALLDRSSPEFAAIFSQQVLPAAFTIDLSAFKSFRLNRYIKSLPSGTTLFLSVGISNLLNSRFATGAFEQLRFDFAGHDPGKFPPKYFYNSGRTYFLNASLSY